MMRSFYLIGTVILLMITGCNQASMIRKMISAKDEAVAKGYINLLRQNKLEQIEKDLDPSIRRPDLHETLIKMAELVPPQDPKTVKVVGVNVFHGQGFIRTNITFEYQFPNKWVIINVAVQKKSGMSTIIGFNVNPISDSIENTNRFTLFGKTPLHYLVLSSAILALLFCLYTLIVCIRTKLEKRKWLWIIFIILGIGKVSINWTTGQWSFTPLAVQLFSAAASAAFYGPWIISVSLPLGAIVFLLRKGKLRQAKVGATEGMR
jgi:hypothetical protein